MARLVEQDAGRIQIDAHAEIEVSFGFAADDSSKMKHRLCRRCQHARDQRGIGDVAFDRADTGIIEALCGVAVQQHDARNRLLLALRIGQRAARQQRTRQLHPENTCAARDQHFHRCPRYC